MSPQLTCPGGLRSPLRSPCGKRGTLIIYSCVLIREDKLIYHASRVLGFRFLVMGKVSTSESSLCSSAMFQMSLGLSHHCDATDLLAFHCEPHLCLLKIRSDIESRARFTCILVSPKFSTWRFRIQKHCSSNRVLPFLSAGCMVLLHGSIVSRHTLLYPLIWSAVGCWKPHWDIWYVFLTRLFLYSDIT